VLSGDVNVVVLVLATEPVVVVVVRSVFVSEGDAVTVLVVEPTTDEEVLDVILAELVVELVVVTVELVVVTVPPLTVNVSRRSVAALVVDSVALLVETVAEVTVCVAREPSEAVETALPVVTVETVTGTEVVIVATGLKANCPILFPRYSVK
jgi:hypothetical protein